MRHLMSPLDLSVEELEHLLDLANDIEQNPEKYAHACDGKKIAQRPGVPPEPHPSYSLTVLSAHLFFQAQRLSHH